MGAGSPETARTVRAARGMKGSQRPSLSRSPGMARSTRSQASRAAKPGPIPAEAGFGPGPFPAALQVRFGLVKAPAGVARRAIPSRSDKQGRYSSVGCRLFVIRTVPVVLSPVGSSGGGVEDCSATPYRPGRPPRRRRPHRSPRRPGHPPPWARWPCPPPRSPQPLCRCDRVGATGLARDRIGIGVGRVFTSFFVRHGGCTLSLWLQVRGSGFLREDIVKAKGMPNPPEPELRANPSPCPGTAGNFLAWSRVEKCGSSPPLMGECSCNAFRRFGKAGRCQKVLARRRPAEDRAASDSGPAAPDGSSWPKMLQWGGWPRPPVRARVPRWGDLRGRAAALSDGSMMDATKFATGGRARYCPGDGGAGLRASRPTAIAPMDGAAGLTDEPGLMAGLDLLQPGPGHLRGRRSPGHKCRRHQYAGWVLEVNSRLSRPASVSWTSNTDRNGRGGGRERGRGPRAGHRERRQTLNTLLDRIHEFNVLMHQSLHFRAPAEP